MRLHPHHSSPPQAAPPPPPAQLDCMPHDALFWLVVAGITAVGIRLVLGAVARHVVLHGIRKRLAKLAGPRGHTVRMVNASVRFVHLRWNGLRSDTLAFFSLVAVDPCVSFISENRVTPVGDADAPDERSTPDSNARAPASSPGHAHSSTTTDRVTVLCDLHARAIDAAVRTAERFRLASFFRFLLTVINSMVIVFVQVLLLPALAALVDIDISRLTVNWTPAPEPESNIAPPSVQLRVRHIKFGWRARSGSLRDSLKAARSNHKDVWKAAKCASTECSATQVPGFRGTILTLHLKLAALISWTDVQLFMAPCASQPQEFVVCMHSFPR